MWERTWSWRNAGKVGSDGNDPLLAACLFEQVVGLGGGIIRVEHCMSNASGLNP